MKLLELLGRLGAFGTCCLLLHMIPFALLAVVGR